MPRQSPISSVRWPAERGCAVDDISILGAQPAFGTTDQPYPGLRSFQRDEAHIFFGRESTINAMVDRLAVHRFLAVTGASGSGKSSLVRTGLLDALDRGLLAGAGSDWIIVDFHPGNEPLAALSAELVRALALGADEATLAIIDARLAQGPAALPGLLDDLGVPDRANLLLLVDQFEETFRFQQNDEADAFVALLLASVAQRRRNIYGVITMRSDFLGECTRFPGLAEAINDSQFLTPRLTRAQMRLAIEGPAAVYGGEVEPALVTQLLNDVSSNPDQLPLIQHILMLMWQEAREGNMDERFVLTARRYRELGGVGGGTPDTVPDAPRTVGGGALSAHLDLLLNRLSPEQQRLAEVLFRCLVDSEGAISRDVRRPTPLSEVAAVAGVTPEAMIPVVEEFRGPGRNFLMPHPPVSLTPSTIIDISHESLIRQWRVLRTWVLQELAAATEYRRIEATAALWNRGQEGRLRMPYLGVATAWLERQKPTKAWAARYGGDFALTTRFLDFSIRRRRQRKAGEWIALALLFAGLCAVAITQYQRATISASELDAVRGELQRQQQTLEQRLQRSLVRMSTATENLGYKSTDFGIASQSSLQSNVGAKTPLTIPGGHRLALRDFAALFAAGRRPLLIDTWNATGRDHNATIPTAIRIPFAGDYGTFDDEVQERLAIRLENLTNGDKSSPLIFFCLSSQCWESYNAALRAIRTGFTAVYWFRGGNSAWTAGGNEWQSIDDEVRLIELRLGPQSESVRQRWADAVALGELVPILINNDTNLVEPRRVAERSTTELLLLSNELKSDRTFLADVADSHQRRGGIYAQARDTNAAVAAFGDEIAARRALVEADLSNFATRRHLVVALYRLGFYQQDQRREDQAKATLAAARIASLPPPDAALAAAYGHASQGGWYRDIGRALSADGLGRQAMSVYEDARKLDATRLEQAAVTEQDQAVAELWEDYLAEGQLFEQVKMLPDAAGRYRDIAERLAKYAGDRPAWPAANLSIAEARQAIAAIDQQTEMLVDTRTELVAALDAAQRSAQAGNPAAPAAVERIANSMGGLAWKLGLAGAYDLALDLCDRALAAAPGQEWINMNRAHALLFLGRTEEARSLYFHYAGKTVNGHVWNEDLQEDFAALQRIGHSAPLMREVETLIPSKQN